MTRIVLLASLALLSCACRKTRHDEPPEPAEVPAAEAPAVEAPAAEPCLADRLDIVRNDGETDVDCDEDRVACEDACTRGDPAACFERALVHESDGQEANAVRLYRRGCELGLAISCTNFATRVVEPDRECAKRIFAKACEGGDSFGCGMQGRVLLDEASTAGDIARGRTLLHRTCGELGGFACRALAKHLESGQLGPVDPGRIAALMKRACDTGDSEACGASSARETFDPEPPADGGETATAPQRGSEP